MDEIPTPPTDVFKNLNKLMVKVLRDLAAAGKSHEACTYAAQAWSMLRHQSPEEADRYNGLLHYLTAPKKSDPK